MIGEQGWQAFYSGQEPNKLRFRGVENCSRTPKKKKNPNFNDKIEIIFFFLYSTRSVLIL